MVAKVVDIGAAVTIGIGQHRGTGGFQRGFIIAKVGYKGPLFAEFAPGADAHKDAVFHEDDQIGEVVGINVFKALGVLVPFLLAAKVGEPALGVTEVIFAGERDMDAVFLPAHKVGFGIVVHVLEAQGVGTPVLVDAGGEFQPVLP